MAADEKTAPLHDQIPADAGSPAPRPSDPLNKIRIDGMDYDFASLPEEAKRLIFQMRAADEEITRLKHVAAIMQDARESYGSRLAVLLPEVDGTSRSQ